MKTSTSGSGGRHPRRDLRRIEQLEGAAYAASVMEQAITQAAKHVGAQLRDAAEVNSPRTVLYADAADYLALFVGLSRALIPTSHDGKRYIQRPGRVGNASRDAEEAHYILCDGETMARAVAEVMRGLVAFSQSVQRNRIPGQAYGDAWRNVREVALPTLLYLSDVFDYVDGE